MPTQVTSNDFINIMKSFSSDEIKGKYGRLEIINQKEYQKSKFKKKESDSNEQSNY